jgi:hypothetical protein
VSIDRVNIKPELELLYVSYFDIEAALDIGSSQYGLRRIIPITGGRFEGERLSGEVLPGGADWQILRKDGVLEVEARYVFKTDDGALIYVRNEGVLRATMEVLGKFVSGEYPPPDSYYFRTCPRFETSHESYTWINQILCLAVAEVRKAKILITVYSVT